MWLANCFQRRCGWRTHRHGCRSSSRRRSNPSAKMTPTPIPTPTSPITSPPSTSRNCPLSSTASSSPPLPSEPRIPYSPLPPLTPSPSSTPTPPASSSTSPAFTLSDPPLKTARPSTPSSAASASGHLLLHRRNPSSPLPVVKCGCQSGICTQKLHPGTVQMPSTSTASEPFPGAAFVCRCWTPVQMRGKRRLGWRTNREQGRERGTETGKTDGRFCCCRRHCQTSVAVDGFSAVNDEEDNDGTGERRRK